MQTDGTTTMTGRASPATGEQPSAEPMKYVGDGRDVILQGFHWVSHEGGKDGDGKRKSWYAILRENAELVKAAGFTWIWFPPPSDSLSPNGYIPRRWYLLDTPYGTETELRAALQAYAPVKVMADVVLNHRVGVKTAGADFEDPPFPDNAAAVAGDDNCSCGSGNPHTGQLFEAARDLDHSNPDVRQAIKVYLRRLQGLGFKGWRYDLVKGFSGKFIGEYNDATRPEFSVGEFFDGDRQEVNNWIDRTGGKTGAFDFPNRYRLYRACSIDDYTILRAENGGRPVPTGLVGIWPSRSVTFVDNHDTEWRRDGELPMTHHFPGSMAVMGYAYLFTHPGMPCVYWSHFFDWGTDARERITRLIQVRKAAGLHARSGLTIHEAGPGLYAATTDNKVAVKLGSRDWHPGDGWKLAADGERYAVWTRG
jgi:alpha-amylase